MKNDGGIFMQFDLKERTTEFGERCLAFVKTVPVNVVTFPIINQFVRSATSIGANYREADCAVSKKIFIFRINIVRKESQETVFWLKMFLTAIPEKKKEILELIDEAEQLSRIFNSIYRTSKANEEAKNNLKRELNPPFQH